MSPTKAVTTTAEERKRAGLAARELQAQADRALLCLLYTSDAADDVYQV